jgi:acyl dehydratase
VPGGDEGLIEIPPEDVTRARSAIGQPFPHRTPAWNQSNDRTSLSHFAFGIGDTNPLWHSAEYGRTTRWNDQIAPPTYLISAGVDALARYPAADERVSLRGLFRHTIRLHIRSEWEWFLPVFPKDDIFRSGRVLTSVSERRVRGRLAVAQTYQTNFINHAGSVVAQQKETFINLVRRPTSAGGDGASGQESSSGLSTYNAEDRLRIDQAYEREQITGADTPLWEDVHAGAPVPTIVKGPLTAVDIVSMHQGMGWGGMPVGPLRFGWYGRQASPGYYELDESGVYQAIQRVHWDRDYARRQGFPAPYDYGVMRACWVAQAITNWMGDDGWLWTLSVDYTGLNPMGSTQWLGGEVAQTATVKGHRVARLHVRAKNEHGAITTTAVATVILPSRSEETVRLPRPTPARESQTLSQFAFKRPYLRGSGWSRNGESLPVPAVERRKTSIDEPS